MALRNQNIPHPLPIHRFGEYGQYIDLSWIHHLVHIGEMKKFIDLDTSVDTGTPKIWMFKTGDSNIKTHFYANLNSVGGFYTEFFEGPTVTALGDSFFSVTFNRGLESPSTTKAFKDGTISVAGKLIGIDAGGSGSVVAASRGSGVARNEIEYILRANTIYLYRATVVNNGTLLGIEATFYEVAEW
jgi:hypothetical protein